MIQQRFISFTPDNIFEKAILHRYKDLFDLIDLEDMHPTYMMTTKKWEEHEKENTEFYIAILDPESTAKGVEHASRS